MAINTEPAVHHLVMVSNVFIRKDSKYLVMKRSLAKKYAPGLIQPIGGKVELNENPFQAGVREVQEEIGIKIKNVKLEACSLERHPGDETLGNWLIYYFSADYESGDVKKTEEGEILLLSVEEFKNSQLFPPVRKMIKYIFDPKAGTVFATFDLDKNSEVISEDINICNVL